MGKEYKYDFCCLLLWGDCQSAVYQLSTDIADKFLIICFFQIRTVLLCKYVRQ